jgi:hypothetical protein
MGSGLLRLYIFRLLGSLSSDHVIGARLALALRTSSASLLCDALADGEIGLEFVE